jgi:hypothetical protein
MTFPVERDIRQPWPVLEVGADAIEAATQIGWDPSLDLAVAQVDFHPEGCAKARERRLNA